DGYNAGFNACSSSNGGDNDGNDNDNNDNDNRDDLISQLCRFINDNPALAEAAALALGYPGAGVAANVLCSLGN
ncbi:MAG: hypothetical protein ACRD8Z_02505, partial [Nitrososphaeraceae archaeon]